MSEETQSQDSVGVELPETQASTISGLGRKKPTLYKGKIPLKDLSFDNLLELLKPRIGFHAKRNTKDGEFIPGFDYDDLFQELSIITFDIIKHKLPKDMFDFDYRFLRYMDMAYRNKVIMMWRERVIGRKPIFRDHLNSACQLAEDFDKIFDPEDH